MDIKVRDRLPGNERRKGHCECGRSHKKGRTWYLTGKMVDFEGQIVYCDICARHFGHAAGMVTEQEAKVRRSDVRRHERREAKIKALSERLLQLQEALNEVVEELNLVRAESEEESPGA